MDALLPIEPENYGALIKRSIKLYKASLRHALLLALLLAITAFIPRIISDLIGQDLFMNLPLYSPHRLWLFVVNLAGLMFFIALIWRIWCVIKGVHEPFVQDFSVGMKKLIYVFVATIIQSGAIVAVTFAITGVILLMHEFHLLTNPKIGFFLLPLVMIVQLFLIFYVFALFYFYVPLIAIENKGMFGSLERSAYLVWNHWWRVFSVQLTPWMYYLILLIVLKYAFNIDIHIYYLEQGAHPLWTSLLHIVIFALFVPWVAALLLVQLRDLELRKNINVEAK